MHVGVLTAWGALRSWTCSGHLHENPELSLLHVIESLAGLPFEVSFLSLADVAADGVPADIDVILNAGPAGSSWSGGDAWLDPELVTAIAQFVANGGGLLGVQEPSAVAAAPNRLNRLQLAPVLGIDHDGGDRHVLNRRTFEITPDHAVLEGTAVDGIAPVRGTMLLRDDVEVLAAADGLPVMTAAPFGQGRAVYLADHRHTPAAARVLENALLWAAGAERTGYWSENPALDVASFPAAGRVLVANSTLESQSGVVRSASGTLAELTLAPGEMSVLEV